MEFSRERFTAKNDPKQCQSKEEQWEIFSIMAHWSLWSYLYVWEVLRRTTQRLIKRAGQREFLLVDLNLENCHDYPCDEMHDARILTWHSKLLDSPYDWTCIYGQKILVDTRYQEIIETSFVDFIVCTCKCCYKELELISKRKKDLTSKM